MFSFKLQTEFLSRLKWKLLYLEALRIFFLHCLTLKRRIESHRGWGFCDNYPFYVPLWASLFASFSPPLKPQWNHFEFKSLSHKYTHTHTHSRTHFLCWPRRPRNENASLLKLWLLQRNKKRSILFFQVSRNFLAIGCNKSSNNNNNNISSSCCSWKSFWGNKKVKASRASVAFRCCFSLCWTSVMICKVLAQSSGLLGFIIKA